jgi:hypothetical protein
VVAERRVEQREPLTVTLVYDVAARYKSPAKLPKICPSSPDLALARRWRTTV